ncbi:5-deoxy-glucuronate isomerase [Mesorhizobium sp. ZC-5]|uniref:5-deoxy-glucuronate isomerase n=1 Tax=Mesorhizobium sp. ZC-5 TaxID=2986066 RepID=UPI0021E8DE73|nr:5-deoxy-glucuronate isomerase [Mesorhizobium sp. ZC-5]MCV3239624.1 5-deoxy-glucuronate isomerase [Mesorhizobium sp. ZC-5]
MSKLLVKPQGRSGRVSHVTPETAGWTYVGFDLHRLQAGQAVSGETGGNEVCLVFVTGKGKATAAGENLGVLGERMSPFEGKPWSVYVPDTSNWSVTAETDLELAVCSAPGLGGGLPVRVIAPDSLGQEVRGKGTNTRYVTNILPEGEPADSLLVVEVITPGGHTSSYPPHKHDQDNLPAESYLEETYYHRLNPPQGFAFQRVYTDDRSLDEAMAVEDGDVVLVPKGYHPCAACHGYDLYYLNVMAGPKRTWKFHNATEHEWLMKA